MDNLYIQVENTLPINHPAYESNLIQAFGVVPLDWVPFVRGDVPLLGVYKKFDSSRGHEGCGCEYVATANGFKDVWSIVDMTNEDKLARKIATKPTETGFVFNDETGEWISE